MSYPAPDPQTIGLVISIWLISIVLGHGIRPFDYFSLLIAFILLYGTAGVGYALGGILGLSLFIILYKWSVNPDGGKGSTDVS